MNSFPFNVLPIKIVGLLFLCTTAVVAEESTLTVAKAIALVEKSSVMSARQEYAKAMAFKPVQAGSFPDPVLSLGAVNFPVDTFSRSQENMTQLQVGISQSLPFPGKLGQEQVAAASLAEAANLDVDELRVQLISRVRVQWWSLLYADKALETVMKNQALLRQLINIAETKYKVGNGLQQDVLLAQLELSRLLDSQVQWVAIREQEQAKFNALLNQPTSQPIILPQLVDETLSSLISEAALIQQAELNRPLLAKNQQYIDAAQAKINVAEKDYYPDFKLGASYGFRKANPTGLDRADLASLTLSMSIPFGGSQDAQLGQRQAEMAQAEFSYQDIKSQVDAEVSVEVSNYKRAKSQVSLFKQGIIPQAKQTVASMLAAYQVNKVDFLNLIRTQVTLYNYETQYWQVLAQAKQSLARLDAAVGKTMEITHE